MLNLSITAPDDVEVVVAGLIGSYFGWSRLTASSCKAEKLSSQWSGKYAQETLEIRASHPLSYLEKLSHSYPYKCNIWVPQR
jgi:hypothetical protein